ncbi:TPA: DNA damage-inducible SOS regulon protein, partial [Enterobacter hormaechei subsp. xiangfangensis]
RTSKLPELNAETDKTASDADSTKKIRAVKAA